MRSQVALKSITTNKASGGDSIPVELFQILKDHAVKLLHSICQQIWKTQQWSAGLEKVSFHSNLKERQCPQMLKLLHNCTICWFFERAREFQKNIHFSFTDYAKAFDYVDHNKLW